MTMRVKMPKHILLGMNDFADVKSPRRYDEQGTLMYSHCLLAWELAIKVCKPQDVFTRNLDSKDYGLNNLHWSKAYLRNENDKEWKVKMEDGDRNGNGNKHVNEPLAFICGLWIDKKRWKVYVNVNGKYGVEWGEWFIMKYGCDGWMWWRQ